MNYYENEYELWVNKAADPAVTEQLSKMTGDGELIKNSFYKELAFGTGGLRGVIGAGTNCLNIYTVRRITLGLAAYVKAGGGKTVCISCDSRINSDLFAKTAACALAAEGIKVYISKELMPTPFLSFATRHYKAAAGIMITASHNPAKYNGYKVYGPDGCQVTDSAAKDIAGHISSFGYFDTPFLSFDALLKDKKIEYISGTVEKKYLDAVYAEKLDGDAKGLLVTYTPLNGTGYRLVPEILKRLNVSAVFPVPEQAFPDGNFKTCPYPNPEKKEALQLGIEYAGRTGSDLLIATDPDADRAGIAVKHGGGYVLLTGNEVGILLFDYILQNIKVKNPVIIKTIVTSILGKKIAETYRAEIIDVLTGFKYIGEKIGELEKKGETNRFVFGFEESYGYLKGSYVRDKDAVVAAMLICQMAAHYKSKGKTLKDVIDGIYAQYGLYEHRLLNFVFEGADGSAKMRAILTDLRQALPKVFAGIKTVKTIDYLTQTEFDLPRSDVLSFDLENGNQLIIRPSGTEPQIKVYLTACRDKIANSDFFNKAQNELENLMQL